MIAESFSQSAREEELPAEMPIYRLTQQVPVMNTPGEVTQVANLFDTRLFDEHHDQNIEFHIHAMLQQPAAQHVASGPSPLVPLPNPEPNHNLPANRIFNRIGGNRQMAQNFSEEHQRNPSFMPYNQQHEAQNVVERGAGPEPT